MGNAFFIRAVAGVFLASMLGLTSAPAWAQAVSYKIVLRAGNEIPPAGSQGSGTAELVYNPTTLTLSWTVTYAGLTGPVTAGHIHGAAPVGANAGIQIPFATLASPIKGEAILTNGQAADLLSGWMYVNLHTAANPGGELRGQIAQ